MSSDKDQQFREVLLNVRDGIEACRLNHPNFEDAKAQLELALEGKSNIIFLVGTTGVGKGVLGDTLAKELNELVKDDPYRLRAICSKPPSPHGVKFTWSDAYDDLLEAAGDPLPEEKVDREANLSRLPARRDFQSGKGGLGPKHKAVGSAIQDRGVRVVIIDEAQNLVIREGTYGLDNRLRVLRDLSDDVSGDRLAGQKRGCKIVLLSTPGILPEVIKTSSEIVRRMTIVPFYRYTFEGGTRGKGFRAFRRIVQRLLGFFPEECRPELSTDNIVSLLIDSVGCMGNLVAWFSRAINRCVIERAGSLDWRHFELECPPDSELRKLIRQCDEDERAIAEATERKGCGLARREVWIAEEREEIGAASAEAAANGTDERGSKPKKRRVGEQNPGRLRMSGS